MEMQTQTFISPLTDMSFKRLFGQEESKALMIDFLNSLAGEGDRIRDITYIDKEYIPACSSGRAMLYDIVCRTDSGEYVVVEMQQHRHASFVDRILCYLSRLVDRQTRRGRRWDYGTLRNVTCICLTGFRMDRRDRAAEGGSTWIRDTVLTDRYGSGELTGRIRAVFLELPSFRKREGECRTQLEKWLFILKNMEKLKEIPFKDESEIFREVEEKMNTVGLTPEEYDRYWNSLDLYRVNRSMMETARKDGIQMGERRGMRKGRKEGMKEGEMRERLRTARAMLEEGFTIAQVTRITGLTPKDINGGSGDGSFVPMPV